MPGADTVLSSGDPSVERRDKRGVDCERDTFVCRQPSGDDLDPFAVRGIDVWLRCVAEIHVLAKVHAACQLPEGSGSRFVLSDVSRAVFVDQSAGKWRHGRHSFLGGV